MWFKRKLACSFCRRSERQVEKLVAGPNVYICDRCAAEVTRIINESGDTTPTSAPRPQRTWGAIVKRVQAGWRRGMRRTTWRPLAGER
jgi:hypothetical protein